MAQIYGTRFIRWALFVTATLTLVLIFFGLHYRWEEERQRLVELEVSHNLDACTREKPISTFIKNESSKTIINIDWRLHARIPGASSDLIDGSGQLSYDVFIAPGEGHWFCETAPKLKLKADPATVIYEVSARRVTFY
jgi:hypothetical protein